MWCTSKSVYKKLYFTHLGQKIFAHILYISCPISIKCCIWFLCTVLLNLYDFNQNWFVESYTLLMGINGNLCFLPNFNITRHMMSPHNAYYTFLYLLSNGLFLSALQSVWDTLHFLYRHYVYHEDGGNCFFTFQMFPPTMFGTVMQKKKKSLHCINLQCHKNFLGNEPGECQLTAIPD